MPTYVYQCKKCQHQFETIQKMSDQPLKECPECNGEVRRLLFPVGIVFKGSGFHVNDYPTSSSSKTVGSNRTETAPSDTGKETVSTPSSDSSKETASAKTSDSGKEAVSSPKA